MESQTRAGFDSERLGIELLIIVYVECATATYLRLLFLVLDCYFLG
jgi:hypothetical protein